MGIDRQGLCTLWTAEEKKKREGNDGDDARRFASYKI